VKVALYGTLFGSERHTVIWRMSNREEAGDLVLSKNTAVRLVDHWIFRELFEQREREILRIATDGMARTASGGKIEYRGGGYDELRSLLCQEAQSHELGLMLALEPICPPLCCGSGGRAGYPRTFRAWSRSVPSRMPVSRRARHPVPPS
jgi:hypothetical protein